MNHTLDFHISKAEANSYQLDLFERGQSQPLARTVFDYDLSYATQFEINQLAPDAPDPQGRFERIEAFGRRLHRLIFVPEIQTIWSAYLDKSSFLVFGLRLADDARALEILPWETLYDGREFISAGVKTGMVRTPLGVPLTDPPAAVPGPLKMLAVMSSPLDLQDHERLNIEQEQENLVHAVDTPSSRGKLEITFEDEAKLGVLENALEEVFHILHYSGHGLPPEIGGGLLLEGENGNKQPTPAAEFIGVLEKSRSDLRLVFLSGCQTCRTLYSSSFADMARQLIQRRIPSVIAMQFSISDQAARIFAENFYTRITGDQPITKAVSAARRQLLASDHMSLRSESFTPVLFASSDQPLATEQTDRPPVSVPQIDKGMFLPLPQLQYGFYGRRREYRTIREGLLTKGQRAIVIHGIGGVGKTALISTTATRLRRHFNGVYAFDCSSGTLAPETILLELHRFLSQNGVTALAELVGHSIPPDQLANYIGQVLNQWPLLLIFDNFETLLTAQTGQRHRITDDQLREFLRILVQTVCNHSRFLFTCRYLFDLDAHRVGNIMELALGDLSRSESLYFMQKLPNLAGQSAANKVKIHETFGGHPYALVVLDRHCSHRSLDSILADARGIHQDLHAFIAIELNYHQLTPRSRELLNRLAPFKKPVSIAAAEWVLGEKIQNVDMDFIKTLDRNTMPPEMQAMSDEELLEGFRRTMPERRRAENPSKNLEELIGWGLLTPMTTDDGSHLLAVHSLVRDYCGRKIPPDNWRAFLTDAAAYYTNQTKLTADDSKSSAAVFLEMDAFELLCEAEDYEKAANLLIAATPLLDRWGYGRYLEMQYKHIAPKLEEYQQAVVYGNMATLLQDRGDYDEALAIYERVKELPNFNLKRNA
ncbi:MAG: CHAT domain-containing protein [Sedimentisphaerales bacterium]|nr:CHAT domain-containing protein [Sedimentisphaerales bacterium]